MAQKFFSIRTKFIILHACAMLIFFTMISILFIYVKNQMYEDIVLKNAEIVRVFSAGVENELDNISSTVDNFFTSDAVRNEFSKLKAGLSDYNGYQAYKQLDSLLIKQNVVDDLVEGIGCQFDGMPYVVFGYKTPPSSLLDQAQIGVFQYYKFNDDKEYIYATKKVDDGKVGLVVCLNLQRIMRKAYSIYGEQFTSKFMIVKDSDLLYYADDALQDLFPAISMKGLKNRGTELISYLGERYIIHYIYSSQTHWYYYNVVPEKELLGKVNFTITCAFISTALLFLLLALMVYIITGKITFRLKTLSEKIQGVEKGIYEQMILPGALSRFSDETDILIAYYSSMVTKIRELIDIDMKREILLHKAKYQSLKCQINPHFLYNTLETVKSLALTQRSEEAANVIDDLSNLLRACLSLPEFIPLAKETELIEYYMRIQKVRFGNRLHFKTDIPESLCQIQIPCMLLQPLVENSIRYALESMIEPCYIWFRAEILQQHIILSVQDNGPGFSKDELDHKDGIGLSYIRDRLKLEYGDKASLIVENLKEGCIVKIVILWGGGQ